MLRGRGGCQVSTKHDGLDVESNARFIDFASDGRLRRSDELVTKIVRSHEHGWREIIRYQFLFQKIPIE